jgi:hypothetical protein
MAYANFYAVRKIQQYGLEVYFYDKLLVAIDIGGMDGLKKELQHITASERLRKVQAFAQEFQNALPDLKDPETYLKGVVEEKKQKALHIRRMRTIAIYILIGIFLLRTLMSLSARKKVSGTL